MNIDQCKLQKSLRKDLALYDGQVPEVVEKGIDSVNCHQRLSKSNLIDAAFLVETYLGMNVISGSIDLYSLLVDYFLDLQSRERINRIIGVNS